MPRPIPLLLVLIVLPLGSACRTYNERTKAAFRDFREGRFDEAVDAYGERRAAGSAFLNGVEAGTSAFAGGDWSRAVKYLTQAADAVEELEDRALLSPDNAAEWALTWTLSEGASRYDGEGYERVLLHATLGLAYLALGSVDDCRVEARRADQLLNSEEQLYRREYRAGGLGHYMSAVGYELRGQYDEAFIDYERLHDKGLALDLANPALARTARWSAREDADEWERRAGAEPVDIGHARVIVIAGIGLGPYKDEKRLDLMTGDGLISLAVPTVVPRSQPIGGVVLDVDGQRASSVILEDVAVVMRENIEDRLALLSVKTGVRAVVKFGLTRALEDDHGILGLIVGSLFTFATERADLRAWKTLPDTWQAAELFVEPGIHDVSLESLGGGRLPLGSVILAPGETMFVLVRTIGRRTWAYPIGGEPVDSSALSTADARVEDTTPAMD